MIELNVLLVNPSYSHVDGRLKGSVWHAPPLGLAYIASVLEANSHTVKILDMDISSESLEDACKIFSPEVVGFTCSTPTAFSAYRSAEKVKQILPTTKIIFGGSHPSSVPEGVIGKLFIDVVVVGEGEITMLDVVSNIVEDNGNFGNIPGVFYKYNGQIKFTGRRELIADIDSIPYPARHLIPILKYPDHPSAKRTPGITILTSRGCYGRCVFCSKAVFGRTYRTHSAQRVVEEIEQVIEQYHVKEILFVDDTFAADRKRAIEICKLIFERDLDIVWMTPNGVRADTLNEEVVKWMKKSGCHLLLFGIESGNPKILENIRKGITIEQTERAISLCKKYEIDTGGFFMIGLPGESRKEVEDSIKFAKKLDLDVVKFGITVPLPSTDLFKEYDSKGFINNYDFAQYFWHEKPVFETDTLSAEEMLNLYQNAYRKFYFQPKYVLKRLKKMNSFQELKNNLRGLLTLIRNQLS